MHNSKAIKYLSWAALVSSTFILSSCGGGGSSSSPVSVTPAPPVNAAPVFSGSFSFEFDEGTAVAFSVEATDPEGGTVTFSLENSEDSGSFSIDETTGEITGSPQRGNFDFENPSDSNADNNYNLTLIASDGTRTVSQQIMIAIRDIDGPLTCSSGERIEVPENTLGLIYTFVAEKKDVVPQGIYFGPERVITRNGGVPEEFNVSISISSNAVSLSVAELNLSLSHYLNAETLGNLDDVFTVTTEAVYESEVTNCSVEIKVVDVENEVISGVKLSGSYPDDYGFNHEEIGDIDGDGLTDFWISSIRAVTDLPPDHQGHVIFGRTIEAALLQIGTEEILISELTPSDSVKISGSFPSVFPGRRFIGNTLISNPIGDIDGDGKPELLLALATPERALESAFADRPLAYLIWGDALSSQSDGEIDLNNLLPEEGIALEGLGGINRRSNTAISGDFDGDGIDDIAIRIPDGEIRASDTTAYRGLIFFVFGDYLRASKGASSIDLLENVADINPSEIVLLTSENTTLNTSTPPVTRAFELNGGVIKSLSDVDGDGADEIIGTGTVSQYERSVGVVSSNSLKSAKGQKGLVLLRDVPDEDVDVIAGFEGIILSDRNGDFDGDGIDDLLFISTTGFQSRAPATLFKGRALQANTSSSLIENEPSEDIINFVSSDDIGSIFDVSFIPDVDEDGRDDIVFSYTNVLTTNGEFESIDKVVLVLAKSLDNHPAGEAFNLDSMEAGDGLHFTNSSIRRLGSVFSTLTDVDGDAIPELLISQSANGPRFRREAYLIPGSDIRAALNSDSTHFDLRERFRASSE